MNHLVRSLISSLSESKTSASIDKSVPYLGLEGIILTDLRVGGEFWIIMGPIFFFFFPLIKIQQFTVSPLEK